MALVVCHASVLQFHLLRRQQRILIMLLFCVFVALDDDIDILHEDRRPD